MVNSGLRRGEVLGLTLRDLGLDGNTVRAFGKGKERDVPLGLVTSAGLAARPASPSAALFLTPRGTQLTRNGLGSMMHRLKRKAGLPQLRCHLLRHTFANHFIANGGGLKKLQKILGHSSVTTTADIYLDPELQELQDEITQTHPGIVASLTPSPSPGKTVRTTASNPPEMRGGD